ncbi:PHP domain-containing protein [candidate division KSB1 bacterium]|nr:PHP domain-containing protein [candidate division KSB1 bacterium]
MRFRLKIDLHIHSREDVAEQVFGYSDLLSAREIIDLAVSARYDAIALTHHGLLYNDPAVSDYARERGLILIPGLEAIIERKHVLLINYTRRKHILTFEELSRNISSEMAVIAPHPFYMGKTCLKGKLIEHIELFDAIEYCHFYYRFLNPNKPAVDIAHRYHLPLVGNSDMHHRMQFGTTYSYVHAQERSVLGIVEAIKTGHVTHVSNPLTSIQFIRESMWLMKRMQKEACFKFGWRLRKFISGR